MILNGYFCRDIIGPVIFNSSTLKNIFDSAIGCCFIVFVCFVTNIFIINYIFKIAISVIMSILSYTLVLILLKNKVILSLRWIIE